MAYTLTNLQDDIRNYTEVDSGVLSTAVLNTIIKNAENRIYREVDTDDNRFYATSNLVSGNRYVTIPSDLRFIRYVQLKDGSGNQVFLDKRDTSFMAEYYNTPGTAGTYVSNKYQDLLLYACLVEAYGYLKGPVDMLQYYEQSYQRAAKSYSIEQEGRRRRDEWQDGAIRSQIKSPSP